jgi:diacylglycerol kinase (ATP)
MLSVPPSAAAQPRRAGSLGSSFAAAFAGMLRTIASQRNMKIHIIAAMMVMIVGMALPLPLGARVALWFCMALVFFAELLNTALEAMVDLLMAREHHLARIAKDAGAAGVLVLSMATIMVLVEVLYVDPMVIVREQNAVLRSLLLGLPLCVLLALRLFIGINWSRTTVVASSIMTALLLAPLLWWSSDPWFGLGAMTVAALAWLAREPVSA